VCSKTRNGAATQDMCSKIRHAATQQVCSNTRHGAATQDMVQQDKTCSNTTSVQQDKKWCSNIRHVQQDKKCSNTRHGAGMSSDLCPYMCKSPFTPAFPAFFQNGCLRRPM